MLELKVTILNINSGKNEELKEKCPVLQEYTKYVEQVRKASRTMPLEQAVEEAIDYCVKHDILREFLLKQRAEVIKMSIFEYDEQREMELIRRDEREIGRQEEREKAVISVISLCKEFHCSSQQAVEKLKEKCNLTQEEAQEKVKMYWELGR